MEKTIAAISTPLAVGGIAVIRISGEKAIEIADRVFHAKSKKPLLSQKGYRASFGSIIKENEIVDEVVATVFRAPKSYTGEDIVEFSCHGGLLLSQKILRMVLDAGAVPAEPGEFTKRAYLNGKMDLTKAESVLDVIQASNDNALKMAATAMEGKLYQELQQIKERLLHIAAHLGAWADYPEEEIEEVDNEQLLLQLQEMRQKLQNYLQTYDQGKILREGVETVIIGKPNAGKSTLMNLLSGYEKSIVTDIAGTTRDIVEERVNIGDVVLNLADTAGIRNTKNTVEKIGVDRTYKKMNKASLVLVVFDNGDPLTEEDREIIEKTNQMQSIAVINKTDLENRLDVSTIKRAYDHVVFISAKEEQGMDVLRKTISELLKLDVVQLQNPILANERQRNCAVRAKAALDESVQALEAGFTLDAVTVSVEAAIENILELTGERAVESVVDAVFANFCVGK